MHFTIVLKADRQTAPFEVEQMKPWWPRFIVKPRVRLARPRFGMPTRPPDILIFGVFFFAILFVLGGNIYTMVKSPPAIATGPNNEPIIVYPAIDIQLGLEGMVASVVIMIGVIGLGLIYYSSRYVFQPGYALRLMALGIILAGGAFLMVTYLIMLKTPTRQGIIPMLDMVQALT